MSDSALASGLQVWNGERLSINRVPLWNDSFLLYNFCSKEESDHYIAEGESIGFTTLNWKIVDRQNDRIMVQCKELASVWWDRIKDQLSNIKIRVGGNVQEGEINFRTEAAEILGVAPGLWTPYRLNDRFRICRYYPGGHFAPHIDGCYVANDNERSFYTFMIYLNEGYQGGSTNFLESANLNIQGKSGSEDLACNLTADQKKVTAIVGPIKSGVAVVFPQDYLHEGAPLEAGVKYIMRTDIVFKKVEDSSLSIPLDTEKEARRLLKVAEDLERSGNAGLALQYYQKAFGLNNIQLNLIVFQVKCSCKYNLPRTY